jgi:hypothetical protein
VRLGLLIVTHQSAGCLLACLAAARRFAHPGSIVVVDNASTDASAQLAAGVPEVTLVSNASNRGFAAAVNQGFRALDTCDLVLLLNPDAFLLDDIQPLVRLFDDPLTAIAAGALCEPGSASPQRGFTLRRFPTPAALALESLGLNRLFPANPVNRAWRCLDLPLDEPCLADQPAGAFLLVRRSAWLRVSGFDERFHPVWFEDVDFCLRIHNAGLRVRYSPAVRAAHQGAHSVGALDWGDRQLYWYENLLRYAGIHFRRPGVLACALSAGIGAFGRGMWQAIRRGSLAPLIAAGAVLSASSRATRNALQGKSVEGLPGVDRGVD